MKKIVFLLSMLSLLAFAVINCNDNGVNTNDDNDTTQKSNPLAGEWYEVGSTYAEGRKVVFTDTTIIAWVYANDHESHGQIHNYHRVLFDDRYSLSNDTLEIANSGNIPGVAPSTSFRTPITFHSNDTLEICHFLLTPWTIPFPLNYDSIILYRR